MYNSPTEKPSKPLSFLEKGLYKETEGEGFEPSVELPPHQFSRLTP